MSDLASTAENYLREHHVSSIPYGNSAGHLVCNQFVLACIRESLDPKFPDMDADHFINSPHFHRVNDAQRGDLVHFPGHIAIVTDPDKGEFWGAQSTHGVGRASYKGTSYWNGDYQGKVHDYFLRWVP